MNYPTLTLLLLTLTAASSRSQPIVSDFTVDDDGWRDVRVYASETFTNFNNYFSAPFAPPYSSTAGNPGGTISVQDIDGAAGAEFAAPAKFLGDRSSYYGGTFSWDYKSTGGSVPVDPVYDLVLVGAGLVLLLDVGPSPASDVWVRRTASLNENAGWHVSSLSGRTPTTAEFQSVLANLEGLYIESDLAGGPDTGFLDNVVMNEGPGIPATLAIAPVAGPLLRVAIQISGTVGKTYQIEYVAELPSTNWITLTNLALPTLPCVVLDPTPATVGSRYYRAVAIR